MNERIIYKRGDRVRWKTPFDDETPQGAEIEVHHVIVGSMGAHVGVQIPERKIVVFYSDEVTSVYFKGEYERSDDERNL